MRRPTVPALFLAALFTPAAAQDQASPPPAAVAAFRAGQEAFQREDFDAAVAQFKAAIAADPRFAAAHCALGQTYMTTRSYAEAAAALGECKALSERQGQARAVAAATRAREVDREILELRESIDAVRSGRVKTADQNTLLKLEERLRRLEESRQRGATPAPLLSPEIPYALGTAWLRLGSLEAAVRELGEAVRLQPDLGKAHHNLATAYAGLRRWEEAAAHVRRAEAAGFPVSEALKDDIAEQRPPQAEAPAQGQVQAAAPAAPLAIAHDPLPCVPAGRFPRIEARLSPAGPASAKVLFRTEERAGWFAVRLTHDDEGYATLLPRPRGARSFRYYLEATDEEARRTRTPEYETAVVKRPQDCAGRAADWVETASNLLVEAPPEAGDRPVPPGFSARGTVGDIGVFEMSTAKAVGASLLATTGVVAGALAVANRGEDAGPGPGQPFVDGPGVDFLGSTPPPGTALSLSGGTLSIQLRVFSPERIAGARVLASLYSPSNSFSACIALPATTVDLEARQAVVVTVTGPTRREPGTGCGGVLGLPLTQTLEELRVSVTGSGRVQFATGSGPLPPLNVTWRVVP